MQFIKYESDDGFLLPNNKIFNAKAFSQMNIMETNYIEQMENNEIGRIFISLSEISFDWYKRVYPRIQSLIAEITSVVNLLILIGEILAKILLEKKMNKDIFKYIKEKNYQKKIEVTLENKEMISKNTNISSINENEKINKSNMNSVDDLTNKNANVDNNETRDKNSNSNVLDNLNYLHIIKSFFCCKDEKTKLINYCNDYISKEICLENLLLKLNQLENKFDLVTFEDNPNKDDKKT